MTDKEPEYEAPKPILDMAQKYQDAIEHVLDKASSAIDRSDILVAHAKLDASLQMAVKQKMQTPSNKTIAEAFDWHMGPEGVFGADKAKILLGYALGLFGARTYQELDTMRDIRNLFAHNSRFPGTPKKWARYEGEQIKADHPLIKQICSNLTVADELFGDKRPVPKEPLIRYTESARILSAFFDVLSSEETSIRPTGVHPDLKLP